MPSEYYTHIHDNYFSDSFVHKNETGFSIPSGASSYSQLNFTESLVDTSSESYSFETYSSDAKGWTTYFNQEFPNNVATANDYAIKMQSEVLEYQFLLDMMARFSNFSSFIGHVFFPLFSKIWIDFQNNLLLSNDPTYKFQILPWFSSIVPEIQHVLEAITNSSSSNENLDTQSNSMFSAFRLLQDQIEEAHQAIQPMEEGLIVGSQDTNSAIWSFIEDTCRSRMTNALNHPVQAAQPMSYGNSKNEIQLGSDIEYLSISADLYNIQNPNPIIATNNIEYPVADLDPSPAESYVSTPTALYIPNTIPDNIGETLVTETTAPYQYIEEHSANYFQTNSNSSAPISHIPPEWLHILPVWSVPVTPSTEINSIRYMSLPASPTWKNKGSCSQIPAQQDISPGPCATFPASVDEPIVYSRESSDTPFTLSTSNSSAHNYSSEEPEEKSSKTSIPDGSDDEYILDEVMDEDNDPLERRRQSKRAKRMRMGHHAEARSTSSIATSTQRKKLTRGISKNPTTNKGRTYTRRTATSYDWETTHYLKSVFYETYSQKDKLTKDQRRQVQKVTGLNPRSITYWFSNHKRRLTNAREKFREARRSGLETYDDFINWRLSQGLPEEVQPDE